MFKRFLTIFLFLAYLLYFLVPSTLATNHEFKAGDIENKAIPRGVKTQHGVALAYYIAILWETAFIIAGLGFLAYLLLGGFRFLTAGGDQKAIGEAKNIIGHALVGLGIIAGSYIIIRIVESIFGLTIVTGAIVFPSP